MTFLRRRDGATAIEYALIAALIAIVIVGGVGALGNQTGILFNSVSAGFPSS